jgi:hypothetical protein
MLISFRLWKPNFLGSRHLHPTSYLHNFCFFTQMDRPKTHLRQTGSDDLKSFLLQKPPPALPTRGSKAPHTSLHRKPIPMLVVDVSGFVPKPPTDHTDERIKRSKTMDRPVKDHREFIKGIADDMEASATGSEHTLELHNFPRVIPSDTIRPLAHLGSYTQFTHDTELPPIFPPIGASYVRGRMSLYNGMQITYSNVKTFPLGGIRFSPLVQFLPAWFVSTYWYGGILAF